MVVSDLEYEYVPKILGSTGLSLMCRGYVAVDLILPTSLCYLTPDMREGRMGLVKWREYLGTWVCFLNTIWATWGIFYHAQTPMVLLFNTINPFLRL